MELEVRYKIDVYDCGDVTVRKLEMEPDDCRSIILEDLAEVRRYLLEWLSIRQPIEEVMNEIENALPWQWVEFK